MNLFNNDDGEQTEEVKEEEEREKAEEGDEKKSEILGQKSLFNKKLREFRDANPLPPT